MKKVESAFVIVVTICSLIIWIPIALFALLMGISPDVGSIISLHAPWWFVAIVWLSEPLFLALLWRGRLRRN